MDHLSAHAVPTAVFGEPAYDTVVNPVANDGSSSVASTPASSGAGVSSVSELIARYPLLAVTAAGAVGLLAVMAIRKSSTSDGPQKQLARYARFMEKAARREYRRTDIGNRIATMADSPEVAQFIAQALEQLQGVVAKKR